MTKRRQKRRVLRSHQAGQWGRNRVNLQDVAGAGFRMEWRESGGKRCRAFTEDQEDWSAAIDEAELKAVEIGKRRRSEEEGQREVTLAALMADYQKRRSTQKGKSKRDHDAIAFKLWSRYLLGQDDELRRPRRHPSTLDRVDFDGFIDARRHGRIPGFEPVGERTIEMDVKWMISVLGWGCGATPKGSKDKYLAFSPWNPETRRAEGWKMPKERTPTRKPMTEEMRALFLEHSPGWQFAAALELEFETSRRNSSVRQLDWMDLDFTAEEVTWRGETDKAGRTLVTPMLGRTREILLGLPVRGISGPVFPGAKNPVEPTPESTWKTWLQRAKASILAALPEDERPVMRRKLWRVGYHSERRSFADQEWVGEMDPKTRSVVFGASDRVFQDVYKQPSVEDVRRAVRRAKDRVSGGELDTAIGHAAAEA